MDDIPCPQCGSTQTLSSLRRRLRKVKQRIEDEKRRAEAQKRKAAAAAAPHTGAYPGGSTISPFSPHGSTIQLNQIGDGRISNDDDLDRLIIKDAHVETCVDCGTFYAPNVKDQAEKILTEYYKLDPLGALAEIYDEDGRPSG